MDYSSILNNIEEQKKNQNLSTKLYRYSGLIQAIEFFSQKLSIEQIIDGAFDFINELLIVENCAIFIQQGNGYVLKKLKGQSNNIVNIKGDNRNSEFAIFNGNILYERESLEKFFDKNVLDAYSVTMTIPLIIDNILFAFIFISNNIAFGGVDSDDHIISEALMKLFNNALENNKRYEELQIANRELDEKIFNLFAINQSSKVLLSELSLDILYSLSVDVFTELTQSALTGFVLYEEKRESYVLKAFKDVFNKDTDIYMDLKLEKASRVDLNKIIIDVENEVDVSYFNGLFKDKIGDLKKYLKARYIVLLIKSGKILGFVTLAQTVNGLEYKKSIFELIESLASSTYIAISNANLFKQVNENKKTIQSKLDRLTSLNNLMKNINSSNNVNTLFEMTINTLDISFGIENALIALYDKENDTMRITKTLGFETKVIDIKPNSNWKRVFEGDSVFEVRYDCIGNFISGQIIEDVGPCPGVLIVPIYIERVEIDLIGVIMIFESSKGYINDEENILTIETIAGHIAPVVNSLYTMEEQSRFLLPNYIEMFKKDLKKEISDALEYSFYLEVINVTDPREFGFTDDSIIEVLKESFEKVYIFSYNNIFIILNEKKTDIDNNIKNIMGSDQIKTKTLKLGEDFNTFQDFFNLF